MNWSIDDLGRVDEVAELRLPDDERAVIGDGVAELEAEHGGLGERAVVDLEARRPRPPPCCSGT